MENAGKVVGALLVGAAVGSTLGLVMAPNKGSKTRRELLKKAKGVAGALKEKANEKLDELKEEINNLKSEVEETMQGYKKAAKTKVSNLISKAAEKVAEV